MDSVSKVTVRLTAMMIHCVVMMRVLCLIVPYYEMSQCWWVVGDVALWCGLMMARWLCDVERLLDRSACDRDEGGILKVSFLVVAAVGASARK